MSSVLLHLVHSLDPAKGGPTEGVRRLCEACAGTEHPAEVITLDPPDAPWLTSWSVPVQALGGRGQYGWTPRLPAVLREHSARSAAVFIHGLWQWQGLGAWWTLRRQRTPYFVFPHGMLDPWFRRAAPLKHLRKIAYWRLFEHRVVRAAAGVIFTTEEERRLGRETFRPWRVAREVIVPLGTVSPPEPSDVLREVFFARHPALRGARILLFLGRIHPKKGCDLLIEAFRRVRPPMHLVFAGPAESESVLEVLRQRARGLSVTFLGPLWDRDKWSALAAADAFVLPSHQENFGIAAVEALASGVPLLLSDQVNIHREISVEGAGLVEADTVDGTMRLIQRWLLADRETMSAAARECFTRRFDIRASAAALARLATEASA